MTVTVKKFENEYFLRDDSGKLLAYLDLNELQELADQIGILLADSEKVNQD